MKVLAAILTTSDAPRAKRALDSLEAQVNHSFDVDPRIFCNSLKDGYRNEVANLTGDYHIVVTKSDGTPGTGKQSVCNWFMAHEEYDAMILIDGDDFVYPIALETIEKIYTVTEADVIGLQSHDMIVDYPTELKKMKLDENRWLLGWYGDERHHTKGRDYNDRLQSVGQRRTPDRLFWFTRQAFRGFIRPWFPSALPVYEDYVASLCCLAGHVYRQFKYVQVSTSNIYIHDSSKRDSTCGRFLSKGNKFTDVDQLFQDVIYPLNMLLGTVGFESVDYYKCNDSNRLTHTQRVAYVKENLV